MHDKKISLFKEMDAHLLEDKKPSEYFQALDDPVFGSETPFTMLSRLKSIKQSPRHHPEGSVWNHTMLVLDKAAARKNQTGDSRVFLWAALLHDIGKAVTTRVHKGKITAYNHDKAGAELTREFLKDFEEEPFISNVSALVRWHMQILYVTNNIRFASLDEMRREASVEDIALLGLCDRLGRGNVNRREVERDVQEFMRKMKEREVEKPHGHIP